MGPHTKKVCATQFYRTQIFTAPAPTPVHYVTAPRTAQSHTT